MPKQVVIYPYKMGSASAKMLAHELGVTRVYPDRNFKPTANHVVINWGNGNIPNWNGKGFTFLNRPERVLNAINKLTSFYKFLKYEVSTPVWTEHREWAEKWIRNGGKAVARGELEGLDGSGIMLVDKISELPDVQLYTKYVPISKEWRVYVFAGQVIDILEKRRHNIEKADPFIRTEHNGWVFCKGEFNIPREASENAVKAISALGLDFGGVDIIYNEEANKSYVLEVNTAPGIGGDTVDKFAEAIRGYVGSL